MYKWTIIVQINGENNLLMDSISAFDEFGIHGSNEDVAFVILMDGMQIEGDLPPDSEYAYLKNEDLKHPSVYFATKGMKYKDAEAEERFRDRDDLTDKANLMYILNFIKEKYKADHYGYIYKGHGGPGEGDVGSGKFISKVVSVQENEYDGKGNVITEAVEARITSDPLMSKKSGWKLEDIYLLDDAENYPKVLLALYSNENSSTLTFMQLSNILQEVFPDKLLSFVLLDCCWGMMLENVHSFRNTTKYLIASADETPALGIGYRKLCSLIRNRGKIRPEELAKMIVAVYYAERYSDYDNESNPEFFKMGVSLTCADTEYYVSSIMNNLKKLCNTIIDNIDVMAPMVQASIKMCKDYTYATPLEYKVFNIDLIWFLENIIFFNSTSEKKNEQINILALELIRDLKLYLITAFLSNNYKRPILGERAIGGKGLTITFPKNESHFDQSSLLDGEISLKFYAVTKWREMLLAFYRTLKPAIVDGTHEILTGGQDELELESKWRRVGG